MLQNYVRQLLVFAFILVSFNALGQSFGTSVSARYGDGCRLDFYNSTNVKIYSLRGSELRYWYNASGQIIVRDENTQVTDLYGISGLSALIDSVQSICLAGLCSSTPPPIEYSFCGSPLFDFWSNVDGANNDTLANGIGGGALPITSINDIMYLELINTYIGNLNWDYNYGFCLSGLGNQEQIDSCLSQNNLECSRIINIDYLVNGNSAFDIDSAFCEDAIEFCINFFNAPLDDTATINTLVSTISNDTTIKNDISIPIGGDNYSTLRILGTVIDSISFNNDLISITAKPIKTSGQTYATNSFKIQKLAYADIDAPVITESVYNPNSGEQTADFDIDEGQNTYCIRVEDTNGNVAYTIFQLTKTPL